MSDDASTAEEIMAGVYRALREHGYADLTMQDIADACSKSKSLLHYHYDTKEDLLVAFLDHLITTFERRAAAGADRPATERLAAFIAWFGFDPDETDREHFHIALLELRSQGPFNDRIRSRLQRSDRVFRGTVAEILEQGIEEGTFEPVDVQETAALLVATLDGARTRQITLDEMDVDGDTYTRTVARTVIDRVIDPMLAAGVELPDVETVEVLLPRDEPVSIAPADRMDGREA
ncbi:TetR/AcrR family transcriptional regulator [Halopenitus persicus]|uniref:Transcriptional regulator, TetR family n=1 Tax=Halopenitus persicus TaxID=1048396 RepID=A0A1H3DT55_9EURY|nr:TetR/AcrR family transcriptional regulator [Halopenitus persicus]QHS16360.1 TetR/AcrR family transcriptional regulator [haloarchaeon 3A1-DGR]SDX69500.1 transcriptional regulator, TetR family [Halopenitus persicus]